MPILDNADTVAIWGFGREGQTTLHWLKQTRPEITPVILNDSALTGAQIAAAGACPVHYGPDAGTAVASGRFDIIIKSPGISLRRPEITAGQAAGTRFTSATNLWFEANAGQCIIAVTGTKGKSSTSRLLHHLLVKSGWDAKMYGNVGIPMLGQPAGKDATVLELSSYQIADLAFAPSLALITNLFPEHAPWHGGVENYYREKLRLLDIAPGTPAVVNAACPRLKERLADHNDLIWTGRADGFAAGGEAITFGGRAVEITGFPLKGAHNYANLAEVLAAADHLGIPGLRLRADFSGFTQLPHRLEENTIGGITCVNDSLSTVPEAAMAALKTYAGRPAVLILGGNDRGQDYGELCRFLDHSAVKCVLLLPATGARLQSELDKSPHAFSYMSVPDLENAVSIASEYLHKGDVFLLSPAAPSFGQFKNYADRGERFKTLCRTELSVAA